MATALIERLEKIDRAVDGSIDVEECVAYEPVGPIRGIVHFVGGAGLGTVPSAAYGYFLSRLAADDVAVIATPYDLTLDHWAAADECQEKFHRALSSLQSRGWPTGPVFGLGHSLGAKLLLLRGSYDKVIGLAPNNMGVKDSAKLLKEFLAAMAAKEDTIPTTSFDTLFDIAVMGASALGIEVIPDPRTTLETLRTSSPDTAFIAFDGDVLDNTNDILAALSNNDDGSPPPDVLRLPGGHLSCVYVAPISVGDPEAVNAVVDAVRSALPVVPAYPRALLKGGPSTTSSSSSSSS